MLRCARVTIAIFTACSLHAAPSTCPTTDSLCTETVLLSRSGELAAVKNIQTLRRLSMVKGQSVTKSGDARSSVTLLRKDNKNSERHL
jgi:hypothetical protein